MFDVLKKMHEYANPPQTKEECQLLIAKKQAEITNIRSQKYRTFILGDEWTSKDKAQKINNIKREIADLKVRMLELK